MVVIKKVKEDTLAFVGQSSNDVTGSMYYVRWQGHQFLIECGLTQSNDYLETYKLNNEKFPFKAQEIEFVLLTHAHVDHCGLLPRLYSEGFRGDIYSTKETAVIAEDLLFNSEGILSGEAKYLSKRFKRNYKPIYSEKDCKDAVRLFKYISDFGHPIQITDDGKVSVIAFLNSHCLGALSYEIIMRGDNGLCKKVYFSGDLGSTQCENKFMKQLQTPTDRVNYYVSESTYGSSKRTSRRSREKDLEILKTSIMETMERGGKFILPCFSFSRTQQLACDIYDLFHNDSSFIYPVIIDSPLAVDICKDYTELFNGDDLLYWRSVTEWSNMRLVKDKEESDVIIEKRLSPAVILTSSGFLTGGRSVDYVKKYLSDECSTIAFVGYVGGDNSYISYKIKNAKRGEIIKINKSPVKVASQILELTSYSSHADKSDLIKLATDVDYEKCILVHGEPDAKKNLKKSIEAWLSKKNKTAKVVCATKGMHIRL